MQGTATMSLDTCEGQTVTVKCWPTSGEGRDLDGTLSPGCSSRLFLSQTGFYARGDQPCQPPEAQGTLCTLKKYRKEVKRMIAQVFSIHRTEEDIDFQVFLVWRHRLD